MYESQSRTRGMIITWVRNWNRPPSPKEWENKRDVLYVKTGMGKRTILALKQCGVEIDS